MGQRCGARIGLWACSCPWLNPACVPPPFTDREWKRLRAARTRHRQRASRAKGTKMSKRLALAVAFAAVAVTSPAPGWANSTAPKRTLTAFASEKELADDLGRWAEEVKRREGPFARRSADGALAQNAPALATPASLAAKEVAMADSVTNVQHAGVDEGGIVKLHGDYLVILRRG